VAGGRHRLFRTIQLFATQSVGTALTGVDKVLTDPFHNIALYWRSPLALLRGEWIDAAIKDARWGGDNARGEPEQAPDLKAASPKSCAPRGTMRSFCSCGLQCWWHSGAPPHV
jgi:hypothetical protein